ncbi:hypothetical protein [Paremcibacter congregatus]|uniref:hypothetical protein n=1 Tax=Paremcibacter congregatus TaxID=2043170 RepID=UPI003A8FD5D4
MIQSEIFVCGDGLHSHPVAFLFHLNNLTEHGSPTKNKLKDKKLVVADGRSASAEQIKSWYGEVPKEMPFLILCPTAEINNALTGATGAMPNFPAAAVMIQGKENACGLTDHTVEVLAYSAKAAGSSSKTAKSKEAIAKGLEGSSHPEDECDCTDFASLSQVFVAPEAANDYYSRLLDAMAGKNIPTVSTVNPPTGMKYTKTSQNVTTGFTYKYKKSNKSAGAVTSTWTIWAFLSQSATENSQYLIVESNMSLAAGSLHSDDSCDRGYGNTYFYSSLDPSAAGFTHVDHGPTSGSGVVSYKIDVPMSYKDPLGGYQVWSFEDEISSGATDWTCSSISSASKLGARWYMTKPCNGDNIGDHWKDAFSTWGHVGSLSSAGKASLQVKTYCAWSTKTLASGNISVAGDFGWQGSRFDGSSCSPGMYWKINYDATAYTWNPGFSVDFSTLQP